jgi:hypothetical protein
MTMYPISRAVRARLGADTAVSAAVSTRIYPEAKAQGAATPCLVYSISEEDSQPGLADPGFRRAKVEVLVVAATAQQASEIGEVVYGAMHGWSGGYTTGAGASAASVVILHCLHSKSLTNYQPPAAGETTGTFLHSSIFSTMYA